MEAFRIIEELKLSTKDLEGFVTLHGKLLSSGYPVDEVPWPAHWPPENTNPAPEDLPGS